MSSEEIQVASRQTFLAGCQRRYSTELLPVSGVTVRFQSLSEGEMSAYEMAEFKRDIDGNLLRDEFGRLVRDEEAISDSRGRLIVKCLVDAEGNRLLTDSDIEQVRLLDSEDTMHLYSVLRKHCGIDKREKAKN